MSIGLHIGATVGLGASIAIGHEGSSNPLASVARDATSGIYYPADAAQWATVLTAAGVTSLTARHLWLNQEASGNLADSIGAAPLVPNAAPTYQNAVAGHTRKGVGFTDGTANQRFRSTAAALPDIGTTAVFMYSVIAIASLATVRAILELGTTQAEARVTTTPAYRHVAGTTSTGLSNAGTTARPVGLVQRPAADTGGVYTNQEKIEQSSLTLPTGKLVGIGGSGGAAPPVAVNLYTVLFEGVATAADIKAVWQTLGWTIPWS